jgi:hypothetical protein
MERVKRGGGPPLPLRYIYISKEININISIIILIELLFNKYFAIFELNPFGFYAKYLVTDRFNVRERN